MLLGLSARPLAVFIILVPFSFPSTGNIYTGSPKHVNQVSYQQTNTYNGYNCPQPTAALPVLLPQTTGVFHHHPGQQHPNCPILYQPGGEGGNSYGAPANQLILTELPIDYSHLDGSRHHNSDPLSTNARSAGNCILLMNAKHSDPVVAMHRKFVRYAEHSQVSLLCVLI